jgi:hypothetical protein
LKIAKQQRSSVSSVHRFYRGVGAESLRHGLGLSVILASVIAPPDALIPPGSIPPNQFSIDQFAQPVGLPIPI